MDFFDFSGIVPALPGLWNGMIMTLKLMVMGVVGGVLLGTVLALMRLSSSKLLANLAGAYVNYFRSIPLLLVITWFYLAVPFVLRWFTGEDQELVGASDDVATGARSIEEVHQANGINQRGVLEQNDALL